MEDIFIRILDKIAEYGPFAIFLLLVLVAGGYGIFKLVAKLTQSYEKNMNSIVDSNVKFAESSEKMVDLVSLLVKQTESTSEQLKFIRKSMQKHNFVLVECIKAIESVLPENKELDIRLENIVKEIQRPLDE